MSILGASFYLYETHDEWNEFSREEKLVFNDTQNKPLHQAAVKTVELGLQELKRYLNFSAQKNGKSLVSFILRFQKILSDKIPTCNPAVQRKKWSFFHLSKSGSSWMMMVPPFDWIIRENCWTESEFSFFIFHQKKSEEITWRKSKMVFFRNYFRIQFVLGRLVLCH